MRVRRKRASSRRAFAELLEARKRAIAERVDLGNVLSADLVARLRAYLAGIGGAALRVSKTPDDHEVTAYVRAKLSGWEIVALRAPIADAYDHRRAELSAEIRWLDHQLDELARDLEVRSGATWRLFKVSRSYTYASQTDAVGYARRSADMKRSELEAYGVEVRVEVEKAGPRTSARNFRVEVRVEDPIDVEILTRKPPPDLRTWLASCWRNGINPRVLNPFLPHGLEAELGIDYFGRDIPPGKTRES